MFDKHNCEEFKETIHIDINNKPYILTFEIYYWTGDDPFFSLSLRAENFMFDDMLAVLADNPDSTMSKEVERSCINSINDRRISEDTASMLIEHGKLLDILLEVADFI
ncbi:MAG: hypothetical protein ACRCSY_06205 [Cetobacterium sp.]